MSGPGLDVLPISKVAFGEQFSPGRKLAHCPLGKGQALWVENPEEGTVLSRLHGCHELRQFTRGARLSQICALLVGLLLPEGTATEEPDREGDQELLMPSHERPGALEPVAHVCGAADNDRLKAGEVLNIGHRADGDIMSSAGQRVTNPYRDAGGGAVFAGVSNEYAHVVLPF